MTLTECRQPHSVFQVLDADQPTELGVWIRFWEEWTDREVFAHPEYLRLFQAESDRVLCATYQSAAGVAIYPFILRDLSGESYYKAEDGRATDLTTPYGYGGPLSCRIADRVALLSGFWERFDTWAKSVGMISEFARLSLDHSALIDTLDHRQFRQWNVIRSLEPSEKELWMDFRHKVRKNVNQARRNGLRVEVDLNGERLEDFLRIYSGTMVRRNSDETFRFGRNFLHSIRDRLSGQFALFHVLLGNRIVSSELILLSATRIYSWLGGTDADTFDLRPNELLKYEIILWAKEAGKQSFILGGGASPDDGIFRYKLAFAPSGAKEYFLRRRVIDPIRYQRLTERAARTTSAREAFFPAYRAA